MPCDWAVMVGHPKEVLYEGVHTADPLDDVGDQNVESNGTL
jgi:hypothetical protein